MCTLMRFLLLSQTGTSTLWPAQRDMILAQVRRISTAILALRHLTTVTRITTEDLPDRQFIYPVAGTPMPLVDGPLLILATLMLTGDKHPTPNRHIYSTKPIAEKSRLPPGQHRPRVDQSTGKRLPPRRNSKAQRPPSPYIAETGRIPCEHLNP